MNLSDARAVAAAYIQEGRPTPDGVTPIIIDGATKETDFAWIFFYDSEESLKSGDVMGMRWPAMGQSWS